MTTKPASNSPSPTAPDGEASFAETALRLGGKGADEARRMGAIDRADDQVDHLFRPEYQTIHSPIHRAVWERQFPLELFESAALEVRPEVQRVMDASLAVARRHRDAGTLWDSQRKIREEVLQELAQVGYWGLLVDSAYGGVGASFRSFATFLTKMSTVDPTIAGLASVHGCIGAVDPLRSFGNEEQKRRYLPKLASGERLSAFALTEPCAGSDLTALRTRAVRQGDQFLVTGEKLFITNVQLGRTIGLVCLIDEQPAVLICDLPEQESEQFRLKDYGLYALKHTYNRGMVFRDFPVPAENLLSPQRGNGLTIAYHGLNLGRVALCATAAGSMRLMLASMVPWAQYRVTYGEPIAQRELVRRRLARLAGLIVACDALVEWCSGLLDQGFRGEMECIIAKIFGSEALKEAAIELLMKTHGGRSFLHGHLLGDEVHEFLAPCIYEGEGEMLGMAFLKSLIKQHGTQYFEPIGQALHARGIRQLNPLNPAHAWLLRRPLLAYAQWWGRECCLPRRRPQLPALAPQLADHLRFAIAELQQSAREISGVLRKFQLRLPDRQCRMAEVSARVQKLVVIVCTCCYAARRSEPLIRDAADVVCRDLRRELTGRRPTDVYFRTVTRLGNALADGGYRELADLPAPEILMPYDRAGADPRS